MFPRIGKTFCANKIVASFASCILISAFGDFLTKTKNGIRNIHQQLERLFYENTRQKLK